MSKKQRVKSDTFTPYYHKLKPVAGSVLSAILMLRIEQHFYLNKDGFIKSLRKLREEVNFTKYEFISAYKSIGVHYISEDELCANIRNAQDFFKGKYYMYFIDRKGWNNKAHFMRNHALIDDKLKSIDSTLLEDWRSALKKAKDYPFPK